MAQRFPVYISPVYKRPSSCNLRKYSCLLHATCTRANKSAWAHFYCGVAGWTNGEAQQLLILGGLLVTSSARLLGLAAGRQWAELNRAIAEFPDDLCALLRLTRSWPFRRALRALCADPLRSEHEQETFDDLLAEALRLARARRARDALTYLSECRLSMQARTTLAFQKPSFRALCAHVPLTIHVFRRV